MFYSPPERPTPERLVTFSRPLRGVDGGRSQSDGRTSCCHFTADLSISSAMYFSASTAWGAGEKAYIYVPRERCIHMCVHSSSKGCDLAVLPLGVTLGFGCLCNDVVQKLLPGRLLIVAPNGCLAARCLLAPWLAARLAGWPTSRSPAD